MLRLRDAFEPLTGKSVRSKITDYPDSGDMNAVGHRSQMGKGLAMGVVSGAQNADPAAMQHFYTVASEGTHTRLPSLSSARGTVSPVVHSVSWLRAHAVLSRSQSTES